MTEEQIIAYVDGELGPLEALRFERAMAADPAIAAGVSRHRRLRACGGKPRLGMGRPRNLDGSHVGGAGNGVKGRQESEVA